jgi:thiamine-phosphate pyrophosphorylase
VNPPRLFVITDEVSATRAGHRVGEVVTAALGAGAPAILLRDKTMPRATRWRLGAALATSTRAAGARLWVTGDVELATELDADGLHLPATAPHPPHWPGPWSRSCHDADEVARARREGAAHVFVAPVAPTPSKPGYGPALGTDGLRALVEVADGLPVVALGGVRAADVADWRAAGAAGLAVMGGVMAAQDPAAVVRALLDAWDATPGTDVADDTDHNPSTRRPSEPS